MLIRNVLICLVLQAAPLFGGAAFAAEDPTFELSGDEFVAGVFGGAVPPEQRVWIRDELKAEVEEVLQHRAAFLRTRYWLKDELSVWILEEIGKEKPITIGVVVRNTGVTQQIDEVKILAFRESRGWEVKHEFFTDRLKGVRRIFDRGGSRLEPRFDGIVGATLSVNAVRKIAEIALILDEHVRQQDA